MINVGVCQVAGWVLFVLPVENCVVGLCKLKGIGIAPLTVGESTSIDRG